STARSTPKQNPNSSASRTSIYPPTRDILAISATDYTDVYGSSRQAVPRDGFHQVAEAVELAEGGVDVRRDANSLEFLVDDRRRENTMLVEEVTANGRWLDSCNIDIRDRARLIRIKRRVETNLRYVLQTIHPVARQVSQSRFLAFTTEAVVKQ